jgi:hypothetical protein
MSEKKQSWTKPQLIVLGRGTPEENVLATCKWISATGTTSKNSNAGLCANQPSGRCSDCNVSASS